MGTKKCFLIAGVTHAHLSKQGFNLQHKEVQVLRMEIVSPLNGEIIGQYLEELSQEIGLPQQIVSDHGNDIKKGIALFCNSHRKPIYTDDITHKTALEKSFGTLSSMAKFSKSMYPDETKYYTNQLIFPYPATSPKKQGS